jgi:hypothetical protein
MTDKDSLIRGALWFSVAYNGFGAFLFAFPSSAPAQLAGFPPQLARLVFLRLFSYSGSSA